MTLADAAAVAAWLGASTVAVSDGRRGVAAGLALYALALAATLLDGSVVIAAAVAAGGLGAAALRMRDRVAGEAAWGILPPGSTPRVVLCVATGVIGAYLTLSVLTGPGPAPARAAAVLGGAMAVARLLATARRDNALAAASLLCLAAAGVEAVAAGTDGTAGALFAAAVAAGLGLTRSTEATRGA